MDHHPDLTTSVINGLGWVYLLLFAMNAYWAYRSLKLGGVTRVRLLGLLGREGQEVPTASFWALYATMLLLVAIGHLTSTSADGFLIRMPAAFKEFVNFLSGAEAFFAVCVVLFAAMIIFRKVLSTPTAGWIMLNAAVLFLALSMTDWDFRQIVGKPDNVPIVGMLFIVGFFTWLYFARAVENDRRRAEGKPLIEEEGNDEKVLVWPDLVYTELICMVALTALLVAWGIALQAPLEEPASAAKTPNPSKAPWYFLGLQEMLVYYDPWMAGVVLPTIILLGLMAIPYIDFNKKGNGYYTFAERKFAVSTFLFGFLPLWVAMIILGTFLRGPNWNFFGPYEYWDSHKLEVLNNVNLSEYFWYNWLDTSMPVAAADADPLTKFGTILLREWLGIVLVLAYLLFLPFLLAATIFRNFFMKMGFVRFLVLAYLILFMAALPIKMLLRWVFTLKYIVAIPEYFFNI